ncbi:MAG TPA: hypothetical protein HA254_05785 [Candidatus Diapherotrites archaeon]|uniref:DUF2226 domain-containing protein n=1 Tax=Candidatus Iainarchaeum sp. TaxID=3101447 RepID=A0A7J4J270_9ARCH|nr:hypothetical protein [Candidatus Diapherotrites archaeon]
MNLPVGEVISRGLNLREMDLRRLLEGFYDKGFSGYIVATIDGYDGVEEGVLIFKDGGMVAALYDYDQHGLTVMGDGAMPHVFNSFAAEYVVADIVSLTNQQVDLVTAFNDKSKLLKVVGKSDVGRMIPRIYSAELAKSTLKELVKKDESKSELFKKLGLTGLGE